MKIRGFEKISFEQFQSSFKEYKNIKKIYNDLKTPKRSTFNSAGYDFFAPFDFILKPGDITKIPTGIKTYMKNDEFLAIIDRSSVGFKLNIRLCNQVGIIDADYYNNENNEGNIFIAFQNEGKKIWEVKKGDKIAQGIFLKYLLIDNDEPIGQRRVNGIGSTEERTDNNER